MAGTATLAQEQAYWADCYATHTIPYVFYNHAEYKLIVGLLGGNELKGEAVLEIGCGAGVWTANLTRLGALVYHFDLAPSIVRQAEQVAASQMPRGFVADMHWLPFAEASFDAVFGSMLMHHARHAELGREVVPVLRPGGRALFHENSARNPVLMLARAKMVGRWGVPKYSSPGEHPLRDDEIREFARPFALSRIHVGRMMLFQLVVKYLLRRETGRIFAAVRWLDNLIYQIFPWLRPLSYYQVLEFLKARANDS